jgi:polysaccharide pyruvyl transferase WcaK-like protein
MRLLLGGVPFGCDNVGDEAILECAVGIVREVCPEVSLTVSTRNTQGTARKLGVETCGLLGFFNEVSHAETRDIIARHDVFIWCGATGLSDYPERTLGLLRLAHKARKRTIIWGVGMNSELNPALYRVPPGRRRRLLNVLTGVTGGTLDFVRLQETHWDKRARRRIACQLNQANLVVVRDPESREELARCGVGREIIVGADSALVLKPISLDDIQLAHEVREALLSGRPRIGICISAQREVRQRKELIEYLDWVLSQTDACIFCIPMNPLTDAAIMAQMALDTASPDRVVVVSGRQEPGAILAVTSAMDLVISSRLHLLMFASIFHVPIVGIARGAKVESFLKPFGLRAAGDVENCDFEFLRHETLRLLEHKDAFQRPSEEARKELLSRLEHAKAALHTALA